MKQFITITRDQKIRLADEIKFFSSTFHEAHRRFDYIIHELKATDSLHSLPYIADRLDNLKSMENHYGRILSELNNQLTYGMGKKSENATIRNLCILLRQYTKVPLEYLLKKIELKGNDLTHSHSISEFGHSLFEVDKTKNLSDDQVQQLIRDLSSANFERWEANEYIDEMERPCPDHRNSLVCEYSDGSSFIYLTKSSHHDSFRSVFDLLDWYFGISEGSRPSVVRAW